MTSPNQQSGYPISELKCPNCGKSGTETLEHWVCSTCGEKYTLTVLCETCSTPIERIRACGGEGFFCQPCRQAKSRRTVIYELSSLGEDE